jgi:hypothetical protein
MACVAIAMIAEPMISPAIQDPEGRGGGVGLVLWRGMAGSFPAQTSSP